MYQRLKNKVEQFAFQLAPQGASGQRKNDQMLVRNIGARKAKSRVHTQCVNWDNLWRKIHIWWDFLSQTASFFWICVCLPFCSKQWRQMWIHLESGTVFTDCSKGKFARCEPAPTPCLALGHNFVHTTRKMKFSLFLSKTCIVNEFWHFCSFL